MNQSDQCHKIQGCHDIFIDAFKTSKDKTSDGRNAFILTHYHSDHYVGLPRGNTYVGPAKIHCTPITANLLREIHKLDTRLIVQHEYGKTWTHGDTHVTFYDANHCPGAAIVLFQVKSGGHAAPNHALDYRYHLHTGDMRFHPKFLQYPLIQQAVTERKLDLLYLDTTYASPQHTFISQDDAVCKIAQEVRDLLGPNKENLNLAKKSFFAPSSARTKDLGRTLVLLSCYSIGKEKVLWHSSVQSDQLVYVNSTKYKMLQCIECGKEMEESNGIISRCTMDKQKSDLHVIQMGLAGSLHPYFQPNFEDCALYAHNLNKGYTKVVAFIPTGWANSSKYNKTHAVSSKRVNIRALLEDGTNSSTATTKSRIKTNGNSYMMDVEIRLVAYSEHSSYNELRECVKLMKPQRVIPTVFSSEKDYVAIEKRFADLVDSQRAKENFIGKMLKCAGSSLANAIPPKKRKAPGSDLIDNRVVGSVDDKIVSSSSSSSSMAMNPHKSQRLMSLEKDEHQTCSTTTSKDEKQTLSQPLTVRSESLSSSTKSSTPQPEIESRLNTEYSNSNRPHHSVDDGKVAHLVSMGFAANVARNSLMASKNNIERAIEWLLLRK